MNQLATVEETIPYSQEVEQTLRTELTQLNADCIPKGTINLLCREISALIRQVEAGTKQTPNMHAIRENLCVLVSQVLDSLPMYLKMKRGKIQGPKIGVEPDESPWLAMLRSGELRTRVQDTRVNAHKYPQNGFTIKGKPAGFLDKWEWFRKDLGEIKYENGITTIQEEFPNGIRPEQIRNVENLLTLALNMPRKINEIIATKTQDWTALPATKIENVFKRSAKFL